MMELVLIRHGESEWNRLNLFTGWTDVDLSERGREEARAAGVCSRPKAILALVDRVVIGDGLTFILRDGTEWTV